MSEKLKYSDIVEISEFYHEKDVNNFLDNGWILIKVIQADSDALRPAMYVLGRTAKAKTRKEIIDETSNYFN